MVSRGDHFTDVLDVIPFTGWLAPMDEESQDGRVLRTPSGALLPLTRDDSPLPLMLVGPEREIIGIVWEVWIEDGWLRCSGQVTDDAAIRVAHELLAETGSSEFSVAIELDDEAKMEFMADPLVSDRVSRVAFSEWKLRSVTMTGQPAWNDSRIKLSLEEIGK